MNYILPAIATAVVGILAVVFGIQDIRMFRKERDLWNHGRCRCGGLWTRASVIPNWAGRVYICSDCGKKIVIRTHVDDDYPVH